MKFQNTFLVNFTKKLRIFKADFENSVTFCKIQKESILKFHNREVNKNSNHQIWKFKDFVLTVRFKKRSTAMYKSSSWSFFQMNAFTWSIFETRICTWSIFHWRDR